MVVSVQEVSDVRNNKPYSYRLSKAVKRNNEAHDFDAYMDSAIAEINRSRDRALNRIKKEYDRDVMAMYQLRGTRI